MEEKINIKTQRILEKRGEDEKNRGSGEEIERLILRCCIITRSSCISLRIEMLEGKGGEERWEGEERGREEGWDGLEEVGIWALQLSLGRRASGSHPLWRCILRKPIK